VSGWFCGNKQRRPKSAPPIFQSFSDFAQSVYPNKETPDTPLQTLSTDLTIAQASLASTSSSALHSTSIQAPDQAMAFQVAHPSPFMPRGFQKLEVEGRKAMATTSTRRAMSLHED
jgi:hypothetical protein